ncbi:hypothetical protein BCV70DRAFT_202585 [Testicularia cyperi]|uniref:Uncharacterized protein n=1 Tax=Testicularia cyperi TaxID=1882483 RepID=A0A317XI42_9BASI|nr:hypothetical protein BCV70DRAFT_202585 [Testicularia cyperi]
MGQRATNPRTVSSILEHGGRHVPMTVAEQGVHSTQTPASDPPGIHSFLVRSGSPTASVWPPRGRGRSESLPSPRPRMPSVLEPVPIRPADFGFSHYAPALRSTDLARASIHPAHGRLPAAPLDPATHVSLRPRQGLMPVPVSMNLDRRGSLTPQPRSHPGEVADPPLAMFPSAPASAPLGRDMVESAPLLGQHPGRQPESSIAARSRFRDEALDPTSPPFDTEKMPSPRDSQRSG